MIAACGSRPEPPPTLHEVPDFEATDQDGERFRLSQLAGRPVVADFIFTSCPSICPMLTAQMRNLQRRLPEVLGDDAERVELLSVTVDPAQDTPEVLREYATRQRAELGAWRFVTLGDPAATSSLLVQGFRVRAGDRVPLEGDAYDIQHAGHFVLLDGARRVRGYYATDAEAQARLERDLRALLDAR